MTKKSFNTSDSILSFWEAFKMETLNQKISRMIWGVHNKSSRLGTICELGRYPLLVKGLCHVMKYYAHISKLEGNGSLIGHAVKEMKTVQNHSLSTWFGRVEKIKTTLGLKYSPFSKIDIIGQILKKQIKSKFEQFWIKEINKVKLGPDNKNHNKLRYYATIKGCFQQEPYIDLVPNRSQRSEISRIRISISHLGVETMRYRIPKVPEEKRYCCYCTPGGVDNNLEGYVDNEEHFLVSCSSFTLKRNCLFGRMESISPGFLNLTPVKKTATLLCPTAVITAKLTNKYIQILFKIRKLLDDGIPALNMGYKCGAIATNEFWEENGDSFDLNIE